MLEDCGVLIPFKRPIDSKSRLARLSIEQRQSFALAMFQDVLSAVQGVANCYVGTSDGDAADFAFDLGCRVGIDLGSLNEQIRVGSVAEDVRHLTSLVVIPADVPTATAVEVHDVLSNPAEVVIVRSIDGGTGALKTTPPGVIGPSYGPNSAELHMRTALDAGLSAEFVEAPGLAFDIDTDFDLRRLALMELDLRSVEIARQLLAAGP